MAKRRTKEQIEKDKAVRLQFTDWLYEQYNVSLLPKYFFINLDKVYKGTYKNLKKPVPIEDLWDMWKRKMPYLRKVHAKNEQRGKSMTSTSMIMYDLAIILSKYDDYLKWKEKQQLALETEQHNEQMLKVDYTQLNVNSVKTENSTNNNSKINIDSILDDI